jgi:osmotically-inducible protein OsmY
MVSALPRFRCDAEFARDIEQQARALISDHSHFRGRAKNFELTYRDHVLTLRGRVPTYYLKQVLQTVVRDLDGVQSVDNRVEVIPSDGLG